MELILNLTDKTQRRMEAEIAEAGGVLYAGMPENVDYRNVEYVDFAVDHAKMQKGNAGYYVTPWLCRTWG